MAVKAISLRDIRRRSAARVAPRRGLRVLLIFVLLEILLLVGLSLVSASGVLAAPVKGEVRVVVQDGFARLMFRFAEEVEADVRQSNNIIIIAFKQPVAVATDRIGLDAPDYVSVARRDPDGSAVRLALTRRVTVKSIAAGERLFVDLLPENWTGLPPGLPQDVIDELAARAREAERIVRRQQQLQAQRREAPPIRVGVAQQPTFTRYVFGIDTDVPVTTERGKNAVSVVFGAPLKFDLADVKAALPPTLSAVDAEPGEDAAAVRFSLIGKVDVRTFREDKNFIVDVSASTDKSRLQPTLELAAVETQPSAPAEGSRPPESRPASDQPSPAVRVPLPPPRPAEAPPRPPQQSAAETEARPAEAAPPQKERSVAPPGSGRAAETSAASAVPKADSVPETPPRSDTAVAVEVKRQGDGVRLTFPFPARTAAAVFRRFDMLWLVFDAAAQIDLSALTSLPVPIVRGAEVTPIASGQIVRIRLDRPKLASMALDGSAWTVTIGDMVLEPTRALNTLRHGSGGARASVSIPFDEPQGLHRITDPDVKDTLLVVTGFGPARGFLKTQDFVEFKLLTSSHGVVIQPLADEVAAELTTDKIVIGRPGGLTLSAIESAAIGPGSRRGSLGYRSVLIDTQLWGFDREAPFLERRNQLMRAAADAPPQKRTAARLELARFYLAREMYPEAKGTLDIAIAEDRANSDDPSAIVLRAIANTMMGRAADAAKELMNPIVGNQQDASLWRGLAHVRQGKWSEAREEFKKSAAAIPALPLELQRTVMADAARAAIEVGDFAEASRYLSEFDALGVPRELEATMSVLKGRISEGLGRLSDALSYYRAAAESWDRPAATQARLREVVLSRQVGDMTRSTAITELETLTTLWRGDDTEVEGLQLLARLYTDEGRFRDAFHVMRTALSAHANSDMTRRIQDEAAATFDNLFLAGRGDALPAIEALSLFYDYNELTPIGRRGDEMIRRLADRLVAIDLLDQGAELLQHQVDNRLQGAARAQVAARLAVIYLMNRKPERALETLRATRSSELTQELRTQRLMLEARALSDTGRHDLALEVVSDMSGREVERLRADILWAGRRWAEAGEQIEKNYGERWREFSPLNEAERVDVLRAAIGYALGEDMIGLERFRQKYIAKMTETAYDRSFDILTSPMRIGTPEFTEAARAAGTVDTLDGFLREMRARFPDFGGAAAGPPSKPAENASAGG